MINNTQIEEVFSQLAGNGLEEEVSKCCGEKANWNFSFKSCDKCGKKFEPKDYNLNK